ncbi:MAG: 4Fe-4S binding protein [Planctomycetota bacterium]|jgi:tetratricopeptide (TPR) repeat protein/polyferredoxin
MVRDAPASDRGRPPEAVACSKRPSRYGRWRAGTLAGVYVLFALHIAHWKIAGTTLAPLELNEVMHTLELGVVTAGFLFMTAAFVSVAIFGRFFCSWGCHILALEDLCAWLLRRIGIRPKPVRSRILLLVPPAALFYMFIWPQISRMLQGRPLPQLRILGDSEGWASFATNDFWRNLPDPGIALLTFAVCGFAIIYVLGSRSFCTYACPYGVVFGLADRVAPGRITVKESCDQSGHCTAACPSHVRVHEEIDRFGSVVDAGCLKCLACVSACPNQAIGFGFTRPSLLRSFTRTGRRRLRYDFSLGEDLLMAVVFIATLLIFRGLYGLVPFLLTLGLGGILAYTAVLALRLVRRPDVRFNNFHLKRGGQLMPWGLTFAAVATVFGAFTAHSAFIRYHEFRGGNAYERVQESLQQPGGPSALLVNRAIGHYRTCERWGLMRGAGLDHRLASLYLLADPPTMAVGYLQRILSQQPREHNSRLQLARAMLRLGHVDEAQRQLSIVAAAVESAPRDQRDARHYRAAAHEMLGGISAALGDRVAAIREYQATLDENPDHVGAHLSLAALLADDGRLADAVAHAQAAVEIQPDAAATHYNLGVLLTAHGRETEAIEQYREALRLNPLDPEIHNNLGFLLVRQDELDAAASCFRRAIELKPDYAQPHFNLAQVLQEWGRFDEAANLARTAAQLDPRFAPPPVPVPEPVGPVR